MPAENRRMTMHANCGQWLGEIISAYVRDSPGNSLRMETEEKAFDEVLVGFSAGTDSLYETYKAVVGELHWTPLEVFSVKFPEFPVRPEDLTVISWVLPQREPTKADNRKESFYPSRRWVQARFPGEEFNNSLRLHVVRELGLKGIRSVAPVLLPEWKWDKSPQYVFTSKWSERHAAYAAGLGTFGLCDGLITPKGKAHRAGSVVANLRVPATARPYEDHHAYCLFFYDGSCSGCRKRCPVGAIGEEGHDKAKCRDHAEGTCGRFVKEHYGFDGYGCGLCQTGVPCESGIPKKILKSMG
jgi:epoxyqueuosine reductase